jgi:hypothetical protein
MDIKSFDLLDLPDELLYLIFIKLNTMDAGVARGIEFWGGFKKFF